MQKNLSNENIKKSSSAAAWVDEDDDKIQINLNKSNRTKKLIKNNENQITGRSFITLFTKLKRI